MARLASRRVSKLVMAFAATAAASLAQPAAQSRDAAAARAVRLFEDGLGATASLRGDTQPLPSSVARCAGCHERGDAPAKRPSTRDAQTPPPRLDAATLLQPASRRRGPPSRYDEASFCRLLATGVDPAGVVVARTMPVYAIEAADCGALWRLLTGSPS
jgi:hypothetical protein